MLGVYVGLVIEINGRFLIISLKKEVVLWTKDEMKSQIGKVETEAAYVYKDDILSALGLPISDQQEVIAAISRSSSIRELNALYSDNPNGSQVRELVLQRYLKVDTNISELSSILNDWALDVPEILVLRVKLQQLVTQRLGEIDTIDEADDLYGDLPENCEARLLVIRRMLEIAAKELNQSASMV